MYRFLTALIALSSAIALSGQSGYHLLHGTVTDQQTRQPLPYVHLVWSGKQYGTATNWEGNFQIRFDDSRIGDTLVFSFMGYELFNLLIDSNHVDKENLHIKLKPATYQLSLIEVRPVDEEAIISAVIKNIKKNYQTKPYRLKGFFRERGMRKDSGEEFLFAEGVIWTHKSKFASGKRLEDMVSLIKGYRKKLQYDLVVDSQLYELPQITQGAHIGAKMDIVRSPEFMLSPAKYKQYGYEYERSDILNGKEIYVIRFFPKEISDDGWHQGYYFIEKESHALVKAKYEFSDRALEYYNRTQAGENLFLMGREFEMNYYKYMGKWYLQNALLKSNFKESRTGVPLEVNMDFVTTAIEPGEKKLPDVADIIPFNRAFAFNERLDNAGDDFWGGEDVLANSTVPKPQAAPPVSPKKETVPAPATGPEKPNEKSVAIKMDGLTSDSLALVLLPQQIGGFPQTFRLSTRPGFASVPLQFEAPVMGRIHYQGVDFPVYVDPQNGLKIGLLETADRQLSIGFSGAGETDNTLLQQYEDFRYPLLVNIQNALEGGSAETYQKQVSIYRAACLQMLERHENKDEKASPGLIEWLRNDVVYESAQMLFSYSSLTGQVTPADGLPNDFFSLLNGVQRNNPAVLMQPSYQEFLKYYLHHQQLLMENSGEYAYSVEAQMGLAEEHFTGDVLYFLQSYSLKHGFMFNVKGVYKEYKKFIKSGAPKAFKDQVELALKDVKYPEFWKLMPAQYLEDTSGKTFDPSTLSGKVVYVDFWSTWCGPCRKELPYSKDLLKNFKKEKDVVFLYISLDANITAWQGFVKQHEMDANGAISLVVRKEGYAQTREMGITSIPRFMLLDRGGRIVDANAPRPSTVLAGDAIWVQLEEK